MEQQEHTHEISVTWRGNKFVVEMNAGHTLEEFGGKLLELTQVKADTMRLIVKARKASRLLSPFSDEHSRLTLQETSIIEGRSIQMMGVPKDELDQVLRNAKTDFRIAGFDEEEKRMRQKMASGTSASLKLPQGPYVFGDFRTLDLPGIELNPPASEALRLMHTLAADPGIVAIMNKHHWHVGIMTEMAPEGYVGVSPVCILGFNKNHGEEISLRLRTDDLKGFRKYQSIKKTLLHELAHMVHSEHDANFYALDKQLNQEAATLDWTRSRGHTLSGAKQSQYYEGEFHVNSSSSLSHKLGGKSTSDLLAANARASSVAAAYQRLANAVSDLSTPSQMHERYSEPDPDDHDSRNKFEPDPDDSTEGEAMESESYREPDPDDSEMAQSMPSPEVMGRVSAEIDSCEEPDPDDMENLVKNFDEPDPDDSQTGSVSRVERDPNDSQTGSGSMVEPDPDDSILLHDQELQRIQDPVVDACNRLQKAIEMLQAEVGPSQAATVIQTLFKIVRNVIEHPDDMKFKKLRKANPVIQRNIASYKAAMEILFLIGFSEDVVLDEIGKAEAYLVLKRNDPGLLWLAKSSLEMCIAF